VDNWTSEDVDDIRGNSAQCLTRDGYVLDDDICSVNKSTKLEYLIRVINAYSQ